MLGAGMSQRMDSDRAGPHDRRSPSCGPAARPPSQRMRQAVLASVRWMTRRWLQFSEPVEASSREPESQIAVALFSTLTVVGLAAAALGWPFWERKPAATVALLGLAAATYWARGQALRGRHVRAMHGYAAVVATVCLPLLVMSSQLTAPTLILMAALPAYAAVCGLRYAVALGAVYLGAAILVTLAPSFGVQLPRVFPAPPAATIAVVAMAMAAIMGPLAQVFQRLAARTRALAAHEERLRLALQSARQGWFDLDVLQGRVMLSPEFESIVGHSVGKQGVTMAQWMDDLHPEDRARVQAEMQAWLDSGSLWQTHHRLRHRNGHWIWVETLGRVVERDAQGRALRAIGVQRDITDRQRVEAELDRYRLELEQRVRERTAALERSEADLRQAKEAAEASSRAKSIFLANMSHELRTPLNAIIGMTGLVRRRSQDPKLSEQLGKVDRASQHLLELISNILDLSKIEAGRLELEAADFPLGPWLERLMAMVELQAREKGLGFKVELPDDLARLTLRGDALRLGQILLNFTANAIKFTATGHIAVRVLDVSQSAQAVQLRFEVEDTGIGIPADIQPRLFTAFEQADGSLTRRYGGTGLGLAISKRLAAMMGGTVGLRSEPGRGSTFWFSVELPRCEPALPVDARPGGEAALRRLREAHAGAVVLLAEDEPINQEVACELLAEAGLQVELAEDGEQAVAKSRQRPYALILMDMQMPRCNGLEATRAIRADSLNRVTPIVAMTANAFEQDRQACLDAGMNDHLSKPVDPDRLHETVLCWLDAAPGLSASRPPEHA